MDSRLPTSFKFSPDVKAELDLLAKWYGVSRTSVLTILIKEAIRVNKIKVERVQE